MNGNKWMSDILPDDILINDIKFPGTHDSGAYCVDFSKYIEIKNFKYIKYIIYIANKIPYIANYIKKWTVTQNKDIYNQLVLGVRALDLRVSYNNNMFYISHTFVCIELKECLKQIKKFLIENPTEIIVLSMKPDYGNRHIVEHKKDDIIDMVNFYLNKYICSENVYNKTYKDMMYDEKNIIFFYKGTSYGMLFEEHWMNKTNREDWLKNFNKTEIKKENSKFINISLTLTPTAQYIITRPFGSLKQMKDEMGVKILKDIDVHNINIIASDFIDVNFVNEIVMETMGNTLLVQNKTLTLHTNQK